MNGHQRKQAQRYGVEVVEMRHIREDWRLEFEARVYLSFDMDTVEPAFAPGSLIWSREVFPREAP
jgi:arginase